MPVCSSGYIWATGIKWDSLWTKRTRFDYPFVLLNDFLVSTILGNPYCKTLILSCE